MANLVNSDTTLENVLTYLTGVLWLNAELALFQSTMGSFDNTTPLATFLANEANFTGYARTVPGWNTPAYIGPYWQFTAATQQFIATTTGPQVITGWFLIDAAGTLVLAAELFPSALNAGTGYPPINIIPQYDSQSI